jgi:hypothetical protein
MRVLTSDNKSAKEKLEALTTLAKKYTAKFSAVSGVPWGLVVDIQRWLGYPSPKALELSIDEAKGWFGNSQIQHASATNMWHDRFSAHLRTFFRSGNNSITDSLKAMTWKRFLVSPDWSSPGRARSVSDRKLVSLNGRQYADNGSKGAEWYKLTDEEILQEANKPGGPLRVFGKPEELALKIRSIVNESMPDYWREMYFLKFAETALRGTKLTSLFMTAEEYTDFENLVIQHLRARRRPLPFDAAKFDFQFDSDMRRRFIYELVMWVSELTQGTLAYDSVIDIGQRLQRRWENQNAQWGDVTFKVVSGLPSGSPLTALMGTACNYAMMHASADVFRTYMRVTRGVNPVLEPLLEIYQGDDVLQIHQTVDGVTNTLRATFLSEVKANPLKISLSISEWLRSTVNPDRASVGVDGPKLARWMRYPSRMIPTIVFDKPGATGVFAGADRAAVASSNWLKLASRLQVSQTEISPWVVRDISRSLNIASHRAYQYLATPRVLGGLGWHNLIQGDSWKFSNPRLDYDKVNFNVLPGFAKLHNLFNKMTDDVGSLTVRKSRDMLGIRKTVVEPGMLRPVDTHKRLAFSHSVSEPIRLSFKLELVESIGEKTMSYVFMDRGRLSVEQRSELARRVLDNVSFTAYESLRRKMASWSFEQYLADFPDLGPPAVAGWSGRRVSMVWRRHAIPRIYHVMVSARAGRSEAMAIWFGCALSLSYWLTLSGAPSSD